MAGTPKPMVGRSGALVFWLHLQFYWGNEPCLIPLYVMRWPWSFLLDHIARTQLNAAELGELLGSEAILEGCSASNLHGNGFLLIPEGLTQTVNRCLDHGSRNLALDKVDANGVLTFTNLDTNPLKVAGELLKLLSTPNTFSVLSSDTFLLSANFAGLASSI